MNKIRPSMIYFTWFTCEHFNKHCLIESHWRSPIWYSEEYLLWGQRKGLKSKCHTQKWTWVVWRTKQGNGCVTVANSSGWTSCYIKHGPKVWREFIWLELVRWQISGSLILRLALAIMLFIFLGCWKVLFKNHNFQNLPSGRAARIT